MGPGQGHDPARATKTPIGRERSGTATWRYEPGSVLHRDWPQRTAFLDELRDVLRSLPPRRAYYPGAHERWRRFVEGHANAEVLGEVTDESLPPALLVDQSPDDDRVFAFGEESFCCVATETALPGSDAAEFLRRAVAFANERLHGTLNACVLDSPERSVVRGPFRVWPKPPWFVTHRNAHEIARRLVAHQAAPTLLRLPAIAWHALRG